MKINFRYTFTAIVVLTILLHWGVWDLEIMGIHQWRQTQTLTVVQNFAFEDMNILNPRINSRGDGDGIFRMEFPLMQWSFAWFYKWFGNNVLIARVLSALIYLMSCFGFYNLFKAYGKTRTFSSVAMWCFAWSPLLFFYAVNPMPDNLALCFGIWSLVFLKHYQDKYQLKDLLRFGVLLMLSAAVKLPFILFGAGFIPIILGKLKNQPVAAVSHSFLVLLTLVPALTWYAWVIPQWTNTALIGGIGVEESFDYQLALENAWGVFHSLLPELFINYGSVLFFIAGIVALFKSNVKKFTSELAIFFAVLAFYLYEVNMIGLAHDYYLFPFVPLIFLAVGKGAEHILSHSNKKLIYLGRLALVLLPFLAFARANTRWQPMGIGKALEKTATELKSLTPNKELVVVGNDRSTHIFLYHIEKRGWTFEQNWLTAPQLEDYINRGAKYLYSNTEFVQKEPSFQEFLKEPIYDGEGITVYPLKPRD